MKRYKILLVIGLIEYINAFQSYRNRCLYVSRTILNFTSSSFQDASEPYIILDLQPGSVDLKEIKNAYRKMAIKYHPDAITGANSTDEERKLANDRFAKVNAAYSFLMDKSKDLSPPSHYPTRDAPIQKHEWQQDSQQKRQSFYGQYEKVKVHQSRANDYMNWNGPSSSMKPEYGGWFAKEKDEHHSTVSEKKTPEPPVSTKHYCKGDHVKILSGEHRGSFGKVMTVYPNMVRVEINPSLSIFLEGKAFRLMTASEKSDWLKGQPSNDEEVEPNVFAQTTVSMEDVLQANKVAKRVPPPPPPPPPRPSINVKTENSNTKPDLAADPTSSSYSWNPSKNLTRKRDAVYQWNHHNVKTSTSIKTKIDEVDYNQKKKLNEVIGTTNDKKDKEINHDAKSYSVNSNPTERKHLRTDPDFTRDDIDAPSDEIQVVRTVPKAASLLRTVLKVLSFGLLAANIAAAMGIIWG